MLGGGKHTIQVNCKVRGRSRQKERHDEIIENAAYFHGIMTEQATTEMLTDFGDFLLRETISNNRYQIALSIRGRTDWKHYKIHLTPNAKFTIDGVREFGTIQEMINFHWTTDTPLVEGSDLVLLRPMGPQWWELKDEDFEVQKQEILGKGCFSIFHKGTWTGNKDGPAVAVAVKTLDLKNLLDFSNAKEYFHEAQILRLIGDHPNVVKLVGISAFDYPHFCMATALVEGGSLLSFIKREENVISCRQKVRFGLDAAKGMARISELGIIHLDLAARNCLVAEDPHSPGEYRLCVSDFGLSEVAGDDGRYNMVDGETLVASRWAAPEAVVDNYATVASDVWSFGVLLWEIFTGGSSPHSSIEEVIDWKLLAGDLPPLELDQSWPVSIRKLMRKCCKWNPDRRPTFPECCNILETVYLALGNK